MPIYTKKGDKGKTSFIQNNKTQTSKASPKPEALGALDELNSYLGIANTFCQNPQTIESITDIQADLFTIGSILAGAKLSFTKSKTNKLEKIIDNLDKKLPKLQNFILNQGSSASVHLQFARALSRRLERKVVALSHEEKVPPEILKYLNRLSDTLFTLARFSNHELSLKDKLWAKQK